MPERTSLIKRLFLAHDGEIIIDCTYTAYYRRRGGGEPPVCGTRPIFFCALSPSPPPPSHHIVVVVVAYILKRWRYLTDNSRVITLLI